MSDEQKIDRNELFFYFLDPEIAELAKKQWVEDGKPEIYSLAICQEYDPESNSIVQFVEPYYVKDMEDEDETADEDVDISEDWYNAAVDRLNNGEI